MTFTLVAISLYRIFFILILDGNKHTHLWGNNWKNVLLFTSSVLRTQKLIAPAIESPIVARAAPRSRPTAKTT